ncbi:hypothetical protein AHAS_Ahas20G0155700 [Arachis hypogaea]
MTRRIKPRVRTLFISLGYPGIVGCQGSTDSYNTIRGVDKLIPVDVYLPRCPPKPKAIIVAITKLRKKISREIDEDHIRSQQENRCFTTNRKFHVERNTHTGNYNQGFFYQPPFTSEITSDIFFKYKKSKHPARKPIGRKIPKSENAPESFRLLVREL